LYNKHITNHLKASYRLLLVYDNLFFSIEGGEYSGLKGGIVAGNPVKTHKIK
jgi:hypothetical protein